MALSGERAVEVDGRAVRFKMKKVGIEVSVRDKGKVREKIHRDVLSVEEGLEIGDTAQAKGERISELRILEEKGERGRGEEGEGC